MLLADARLDLSKTFVGALDDSDDRRAERRVRRRWKRRRAPRSRREFGAGEVVFERHAEMRYRGQRHNIKVPISGLGDAAAIREAFDRDYKRRYGHADARAAAEIPGAASVGLRAAAPARARAPAARAGGRRGRAATRPVYFGSAGGMVETRRSTTAPRWRPGFSRDGPGDDRGIRLDHAGLAGRPFRDRQRSAKSAFTVRGDRGSMHAGLARQRRRRAAVDPITLEVIRHGLVSITNQIDANIKRTAFSPYIYEYNDFAVGLVDADGQLIAQCTGGMPPFVADSVGMAVRDGLADLRPRAAASRRRRGLQSRRGAGPAPQQHGDVHADLCRAGARRR